MGSISPYRSHAKQNREEKSREKIFWQSGDSNPGLLGEKNERYLCCAMLEFRYLSNGCGGLRGIEVALMLLSKQPRP